MDHLTDLYLEGNRDSVYNIEDSSYIIVEIHKCSEATKFPGNPDCAPV
jgi:hypothetical protein